MRDTLHNDMLYIKLLMGTSKNHFFPGIVFFGIIFLRLVSFVVLPSFFIILIINRLWLEIEKYGHTYPIIPALIEFYDTCYRSNSSNQ